MALQSTTLAHSASSFSLTSKTPFAVVRGDLGDTASWKPRFLEQRSFRSPSLPCSLRSSVSFSPGFFAARSRQKFGAVRCFASVLTPQLKTALDNVVTSNKVVLFMKGTKDFPQCGFSNTVVQILKSVNVPFETVNILDNEMLRQGLKEYSNWPTFPQLYIDGEFFGGCDITLEAYQNGQLQEILEKAMCS